jgi:bleomycin hydrolase
MLENAKTISQNELAALRLAFEQDTAARAMQNAASKTAIGDLVYHGDSRIGNDHLFSLELNTMKVTNQMSSGRCWIFAGCNILREIIAKKIGSEDFELSQNFVAFYDKLEKVNFTLEAITELADRPADDRTLQTVLRPPVQDGGQWDMFRSLVKKYGIVPKNVMPETWASSHTMDSNYVINTALRRFAAEASRLKAAGKLKKLKARKEEILAQLYRVLGIAFGLPAERFDFEYKDKDKNYHCDPGLTPLAFYEKYVGEDIDEYVSLINSPTADKPYYETFTVDYVGNVVGGDPIHYLNLPMKELKAAVIASLKDGEPVWFGSDCGKFGDRAAGVWAPEQYDYAPAFGFDLKMDKADMLDFAQSAMNHAMVITGVNLADGKPTKWKIENSWGDEKAYKGYYTATDLWFDYFVYQAVVKKKYLSKKQLAALAKEPKHLNPWDPMGTLA